MPAHVKPSPQDAAQASHAVQRRALAAALVLAFVWGASFTIQKAAYTAIGPGGFLFARSLVMCLCALLVLRWRGSPLVPKLTLREWQMMVGLTLLGPVAHIAIVTYGIHWSTPFSSALLMACGPIFTLLLLRLLRGTHLQRTQLIGVLVAMSGVLLFMSDKLLQTDWRASGGDLMLILSTVLFSLYTIWVTPVVARYGGPEIMSWTTLLAAPFLLIGTASAAWSAPYASVGPAIWGAFFWTVLVSAFAGWIVWTWVNAVRGIARTAPLMYLIPPVAGLVAWLTGGESFTAIKCLGGALALAGVAWAQWAPRGRVELER